MQLNTRKERFSLAYIAAIAARAGFEFLESDDDFDSVDGLLRSARGRRPKIEFQAKSTSRDLVRADHVAFPLGLKNYDSRARMEKRWSLHEQKLRIRIDGELIRRGQLLVLDNARNLVVFDDEGSGPLEGNPQ